MKFRISAHGLARGISAVPGLSTLHQEAPELSLSLCLRKHHALATGLLCAEVIRQTFSVHLSSFIIYSVFLFFFFRAALNVEL